MGPVFTRLLFITTLLIQTPANPAADKGVITGRLLTIDGTPAVAVRVMAMAVSEPAPAAAAGNAVAIVSLTETDSAGRYRLENIPAGKYYVTAGLTDLPTYYPGVLAAAAATVITVAPGSIANGIDFPMQRGTGIKVAGRLAVLPTLKPSVPYRVALSGTALSAPMQTTVNEDGTFVFPMVRPGTYSLRSTIGLNVSSTIVVTDRDVNVVVGADDKGVRVIGKAVLSSGADASVSGQSIALKVNGMGFSTPINADGTFEFLRVPPGTYTVFSSAATSADPSTPLVVADKDITNLEVSVPFLALVPGSISVEAGGTPPPQIWSIETRSFNGTTATGVSVTTLGSIGPFTLRLSEGSHLISIRNLPLGYLIKSITSGDQDLTKSLLDVRPGKPIEEVRIAIGKSPVAFITGANVSGKVSGLTGDNLLTARVALSPNNAGGFAIETRLNADGTFEFSSVPTGPYSARLTGPPPGAVTPPISQVFVQESVSGLQFTVSPMTQIRGTISAVDGNGAAVAGLPANISIQIRRDNNGSGSGTLSQSDGTFGMMVAEGEYNINVGRLPAGYTVKSIRSGSIDVTHSPLKISGAQRVTDIQIVLESR